MATSVTYVARETSSTAQANELILNGNTAPATTITFYSDIPSTPADENGNLILEHNGGSPDPDTWVMYNGSLYTFTFTVVGSVQNGNTDFPSALWGKSIAKIVLHGTGPANNDILFFTLDNSATIADLNGISNGRKSLVGISTNPPPTPVCFCEGVEILTPAGARKVETLRAGDMIVNDRGEARQLIWVGRTDVSKAGQAADPGLCPIRIPADAIAPGLPTADLHVSPQHRVVLEGPEAELLFGEERVLVPAKHLADSLAEVVAPAADVTYYHLLCEDHEILISNGLPSESFQPARRTIDVMSAENRARLEDVLTALGEEEMLTRKDALVSLRRPEALLLADAIAQARASMPAPVARGELRAS